jgi:FlaA1/EpsC-like NDP-sugar epimerase
LHALKISIPLEHRDRISTTICDIRDEISVQETCFKSDWSLVIHAAALKHVSVLEDQPREAFLTNVIGTLNVVKTLQNTNYGRLIFISSDKAADPSNILGKTKLIGELLIAGLKNFNETSSKKGIRSVGVVRFGNVFLSRGSVLETFIKQIELRERLTLTSIDMKRYFMNLSEASDLTLQMSLDNFQGVRILKMGEQISIHELAKRLITWYGSKSSIEITEVKQGEKMSEVLFGVGEQVLFETKEFWDVNFSRSLSPESLKKASPLNDKEAIELIEKILE